VASELWLFQQQIHSFILYLSQTTEIHRRKQMHTYAHCGTQFFLKTLHVYAVKSQLAWHSNHIIIKKVQTVNKTYSRIVQNWYQNLQAQLQKHTGNTAVLVKSIEYFDTLHVGWSKLLQTVNVVVFPQSNIAKTNAKWFWTAELSFAWNIGRIV